MIKKIKAFQRSNLPNKWCWVSYNEDNKVVGCSIQSFDDQIQALKAAEQKYKVMADYTTGNVIDKLIIKI